MSLTQLKVGWPPRTEILRGFVLDGYPDNYNPAGHSGFEGDALILRAFRHTLIDYPSLDFVGDIAAGPGHRKVVLSSPKEALAYMASRMGEVGTIYLAQQMNVAGLALEDGRHVAEVWKPVTSGGLVERRLC